MNLIVRMVEHHLWLVGEMVEKAAKVDEAALDRPIELNVEGLDAEPTMRKLLSRLVGQMDMWVNVINGRDYDMAVERHEPIGDMRARLAVAGPRLPGRGASRRRGRPPRRDVHRRAVRAGRGVHLRRADRPRADVRGAPPDPGPRRPRVGRRSGPRQRRSAQVGGGRRLRPPSPRSRAAERACRTWYGRGRARSSAAEQGTFNPRVVGSNPTGPSNWLPRGGMRGSPASPIRGRVHGDRRRLPRGARGRAQPDLRDLLADRGRPHAVRGAAVPRRGGRWRARRGRGDPDTAVAARALGG